MNREEQDLIRGLFGRLSEVERTAAPRDPEAEGFIGQQLASQPGAPYYMAQTIIVQEQALEAAKQRITELEQEAERGRSSGGLFGGLFGGGSRSAAPRSVPSIGGANRGGAYGAGAAGAAAQAGRPAGGGFLAGAAQTAVGVAGGMMLANMLGGMFAGDEAQAAETADAGAEDAAATEDTGGGFDDGGGFDFGGDEF
ncbi:DUF2076 domain-containing protein [Methylobrevis albus]|uniref:DUF2076 domain-containing protein n=1 Tax=Methylobrevis albus TaxID=2793297 RepID=A0A931MYR3_9HYPH|nr:DUF2076 domain-containing protein [Methylobrevis albus]MBH0238255.1 DUF2076 domain-containing protein [Methylobrevis albus]